MAALHRGGSDILHIGVLTSTHTILMWNIEMVSAISLRTKDYFFLSLQVSSCCLKQILGTLASLRKYSCQLKTYIDIDEIFALWCQPTVWKMDFFPLRN